ncbi:serine/threonine protein kinase [Candidatus Koribacter versatilis Ellin345]|uniref:non-specific serine/threonine protein kinase n=1 Tax=Koribacter versatilis (strain Ellin345) TaxID=204669 RepID=Q1II42_KORVE|nr:serine/threonine-protein kinase [Candidatus Koribacter versatilis]ABF43458.1 serine/threonine protein kinase [Candidatus Koribacter versatilis Ellin345]
MEIRAGANLGRYQLLAEIGRGAMGTVYQALDPEIDRLVAIKTFSAFDSTSHEGVAFRDRFAQEARAAGRLAHPGIVAIYDRGEEPSTGSPYIVMEYIAGQPLSRLLAQSGGRLEERYALTIVKELAEALAYAHEKGVVHRDIKPANILITEDGNPKIADFGVARIDASTMTFHGQLLGTPAYMSPEQLTGGLVDGRSDLFSLGVILYTVLMGFRPFQGNGASTIGFKVINQHPLPITTFHLDLSKDTEYVVARAMAKNPRDRYQNGAAFALDLEDILADREPRSRHEPGAPPSSEILRVFEKPQRTNGNGTSSGNASAAFGVAPARVAPSPPKVVPTRSSWQASSTMLGLALLAFAGIVGVAAFYINDTQRTALRDADASLPLPPLIAEQIPMPAITGAQFEPIIQINMPEPPRQYAGSGVSPRAPLSDLDRTVIRGGGAAPVTPIAASPKSSAAWSDPLVARQPATVELALQHHFTEAEIQVWVDGRLEFSTTTHGENKKHLFGLKSGIEGRESHEIRFPSGEHEVKVRVASKADEYDQTGSIHSTFLDSRRSVLDIRCNKRGLEMRLNDGS